MSGAAKIVVAITMSATKTLRAVPERVLEAFLFTTTSTRLGSNLSGGELRRTTGVRGVRLGRGGANDIYYELIKKYQVIVGMNNRKCSVSEDGNIYQDLSAFDVPLNVLQKRKQKPGTKTFEAALLGDVVDSLSTECFTFHRNCKSQYPKVGSNGIPWQEIMTSLDQENRMSLAHVLEHSKVPTLFNTPRLCDPGMVVSKNWSLRNYIETRLVDFKYTYNLGKNVNKKNGGECYPRIVFDFRPFEYIMRLPNPRPDQSDDIIYVTEWITVDQKVRKDLGYSPHISMSKTPLTDIPRVSSREILKKMVLEAIKVPLNTKLTKKVNIGPIGTNMNANTYIENFIQFLEKVDDIKFMDNLGRSNANTRPEIVLTDDVLAILYYDLLHDTVFTLNNLPFAKPIKIEDMPGNKIDQKRKKFQEIPSKFRKKSQTFAFKSKLKDEFKRLTGESRVDDIVGKEKVKTSVSTYGPWIIQKPNPGALPALLKTLGDLSQYIYASKYRTVVASGDKMGVAAGLYINAKMNRSVKCMIEDSTTGFVVYSGFRNLPFRARTSCNVRSNSTQACPLNTSTNSKTIANIIRQSAPDKELLQKMIRNKPKRPSGLRGLPNQWINSASVANTAAANVIANSIIKFKNYWGEEEANKLIKAYNGLKNKISGNKGGAIQAIINGILPEGKQLRVTRGAGVSVVNSVSPSPMNVNSPTNNRAKLRDFLNRSNLNRLTPNNKNQFMKKLNQNGSNLNTIMKTAYNLHRVRVFNSEINRKRLTNQQYNNFVRRIKNNEKLNKIVEDARRGVKRQRFKVNTPNMNR
jgi:hypothetical protein